MSTIRGDTDLTDDDFSLVEHRGGVGSLNRRQGNIETAHQSLERYERTRNVCAEASIRALCAWRTPGGSDAMTTDSHDEAGAGGYGRIECALRILNGGLPGLSPGWRHGLSHLGPRRISFRRSIWQWTLANPFAAVIDIDVESVAPHRRRRKGLREIWSISADLVILTVETRHATLEWGVPSEDVDWILIALSADQSDPGRRLAEILELACPTCHHRLKDHAPNCPVGDCECEWAGAVGLNT